MNQWSKNLKQVQRQQQKVLNEIQALEKQGYVIGKGIKEAAMSPIGSRYTKQQANDYSRKVNLGMVRRSAKMPIQITAPKFGELTAVPRKGESEERALTKQLLEDIRWGLKNHPSQQFGKDIKNFFGIIVDQLRVDKQLHYLPDEYVKRIKSASFKNAADILPRGTKETQAFLKAIENMDFNYVRNQMGSLLESGRLNPKSYEGFKLYARTKQWGTFTDNYLDESSTAHLDNLLVLNDLFKSEVWRAYRKDKNYYEATDKNPYTGEINVQSRTVEQLVDFIDEVQSKGKYFDTEGFTHIMLQNPGKIDLMINEYRKKYNV